MLSMVGRLEECYLLAYRTPAAAVQHLIPQGLELVTHGEWAFWNIVVSRVLRMRPKGCPAALGISYLHTAYRLYVRATTADGATIQGLYFLRSDVNSRLIAATGDLFTDFRFHHAKIGLDHSAQETSVQITGTQYGLGDAELRLSDASVSNDSCFASPEEAATLLKYRPFGLSVAGRRLKLAEVFRNEREWHETPVAVLRSRWNYLESLGQHNLPLEQAIRVAPIDYRWRLGRTERLL
jgi:hypothetical protein